MRPYAIELGVESAWPCKPDIAAILHAEQFDVFGGQLAADFRFGFLHCFIRQLWLQVGQADWRLPNGGSLVFCHSNNWRRKIGISSPYANMDRTI
jgi:hypothetical protein